METINEQLGTDIALSIDEKSVKSKNKGKREEIKKSIFAQEENLELTKLTNPEHLNLVEAIIVVGDHAYIGNFTDATTKKKVSIKVIAKDRSVQKKMMGRLLQERNFLATFFITDSYASANSCVAHATATFHNAKACYMSYSDVFICDLALAMQSGALPNEAKPYFAACIANAVNFVHSSGVIHRFVNPGAIYVTALGVPKLTDFRYAKEMDGSRCYTICGDSLFFAPEIVGQQGYDYAADIWAMGILFFELCEDTTPFGSGEKEETALFREITKFTKDSLKFTAKTGPEARQLIGKLLNPTPSYRLGYKDEGQAIRQEAYFTGISWNKIGIGKGHVLDIQPTVEASSIFQESELPKSSTNGFDQF